MKKRLLSLLLTLVMILGMIPATTLTASAADTDNRIYGGKETSKVETTDYGGWYEDDNGHIVSKDLYRTTLYWIDRVNLTSAYQNPNTWSELKLTANFPTGSQPPDWSFYYTNNFVSNLEYVWFGGIDTAKDAQNTFYRTKVSDGGYLLLFDTKYYYGERDDGGWERREAARIYQTARLYDTSNQSYYVPEDSNYPVGSYIVEYKLDTRTSIYTDYPFGVPNITFDSGERMKVTLDGATLAESNTQYVPKTYYLVETDWDDVSQWYYNQSDGNGGVSYGSMYWNRDDAKKAAKNAKENSSPNTLNHQLYAYGEKFYVYDVKPEINSVTVNGQSIADEGTFTTNNKNVTIKTTYDSVLSDALTAYGCKVEHLSDWYLNGQHITLAKATPVDQGDGTSTKTYTRPLNDGDVLKVYSRLEVIWPDGSRDIVDEHTVTAMHVDADFESISPAPTASELTNKYTDLGTMDLGSAATNIDFKAFPKKLSADAIEDGWTTGRSISVTRDGVEIYNRTYADNELFGWNLKDNIDEGGTYLITLRVFAQKGEQIVEKTHKFRVFVKGSTIKTIALEGVGTPVIGKSPSTINTVKSNTDGVIVNKVVWTEYKQGDGGVWDWFNMSAGSTFESGKRYAVIVEFKHEDGYNFTANKADMTVYINGQKATVNAAYSSDAFGVTLEFDPITTPVFTTQPVGGEAPYGGTYTVNWATNFTPVKVEILQYQGVKPSYLHSTLNCSATSASLEASERGYCVRAYYNDTGFVDSNKFTITETIPAFTTQPVGGEVAPGEKLTVTWATNFTPVKSVLMKVVTHPVDGTVTTRETLGAASTAEVGAGYDYYFIRAYTETSYVDSDKFYVTEKVSGSGVTVSGTVTSFNSNTDTVTIQLIEEGHAEVAYEVTTTGNSATYSITDVVAGTYTMKVSKNNHVTREYTVTVGSTAVTQDAKIHLLGDINGDGKVTTIDFGRANAHAKGTSTLTGYELLCADTVKQDGLVTTADAARINAHARGTSTLW